ncbi:MAG: hypothetical protein IPH57_12885 [Saprospiraceae bacterium]|nr:hypothetical protein [Saprospiraceae bacterium]
MNHKLFAGLFLLYSFYLYFPVRLGEKPLDVSKIDFSDETFRMIMNFQDKRETDSIIKYLNHENALYRYAPLILLSQFRIRDW